jgi:hypothetical protein
MIFELGSEVWRICASIFNSMEIGFPKIIGNFKILEGSIASRLKVMFKQSEVIIDFLSGLDVRMQKNLKFVSKNMVKAFSTELNSAQLQIITTIGQKVDILSIGVQRVKKSVVKLIDNGMQNLYDRIKNDNVVLIDNFGNNMERLMNQFRDNELAEHMDLKNLIEFSFNNSNDKITSELIKLGETTEGNLLILDKNLVIFYEEFRKSIQAQYESFDAIKSSFTQFELNGRRRDNDFSMNFAKSITEQESHHKIMVKEFLTVKQTQITTIGKIEEVSTEIKNEMNMQGNRIESIISSKIEEGNLSVCKNCDEMKSMLKSMLENSNPKEDDVVIGEIEEKTTEIKDEMIAQGTKLENNISIRLHENNEAIGKGFEGISVKMGLLMKKIDGFSENNDGILKNLGLVVKEASSVISTLDEEWSHSNIRIQNQLGEIKEGNINLIRSNREILEQGKCHQKETIGILNTIGQQNETMKSSLDNNYIQIGRLTEEIKVLNESEEVNHNEEMNVLMQDQQILVEEASQIVKLNEKVNTVIDDQKESINQIMENLQEIKEIVQKTEDRSVVEVVTNLIAENDNRRNENIDNITGWLIDSYKLLTEVNSNIGGLLNLGEKNKSEDSEMLRLCFDNLLQKGDEMINDVYIYLARRIEDLKNYMLQSNQATREDVSNMNRNTNTTIREIKKYVTDSAQLNIGKTKEFLDFMQVNLDKMLQMTEEKIEGHINMGLQELFNEISIEIQKNIENSNEAKKGIVFEIKKMNDSEALRNVLTMGMIENNNNLIKKVDATVLALNQKISGDIAKIDGSIRNMDNNINQNTREIRNTQFMLQELNKQCKNLNESVAELHKKLDKQAEDFKELQEENKRFRDAEEEGKALRIKLKEEKNPVIAAVMMKEKILINQLN